MSTEQPVVSICCLVYNHEPYLRECFDGFVMQETTFPIEILVHDDASTDHSADIIREYTAKYPDLFKPIYQTENQYSKGNGFVGMALNLERAKGRYIALCEGDDYWTDPLKLQRQVDFMEEHVEYSATTENGLIFFEENKKMVPFSEENAKDISFDELLIKRRFPTASVVYRSCFSRGLAKLKPPLFDTLIWVYLATKGKIHYDTVISSVYRRGCGITSKDRIRWAYTIISFNVSLYSNFEVPAEIKAIRNEDVCRNIIKGIVEAKRQKCYRDVLKLLYYGIKMYPKRMIVWMIKRILGK